METKIKLKNIYLIMVIAIGLMGLGIGSTFAMFTATANIDNPIAFNSNLSSTNVLTETIEVAVQARSDKSVDLVISNTSGESLNYAAWYISSSNNTYVGSISSSNSYSAVGTLPTSTNFTLTVEIVNNNDVPVNVTLGVSSSPTTPLVIPSGTTQVPSTSVFTPITDFLYVLGSDETEINGLTLNLEPYCISQDGCNRENYLLEDYLFSTPIEINQNDILITSYTGTSPSVIIPNTYTISNNTYNVKILSNTESFMYNDNHTGDEFDYDSGYGAFNYNTLIESIIIGNSVNYLGYDFDLEEYSTTAMYYTFRECSSLETAPIIPSSVTNMYATFSGCASLVNVPTIPSSVTKMAHTFFDCTSLVNVPEIPSFVTDMENAFGNCTSLVSAPTIPSSVTYMKNTFKGCTSLVDAPTIPNSVTNMIGTFEGCTSLVNAPAIPNLVTRMDSTFKGCTSLVTAPTIGNSVTNMSGTFFGCTSLVNAPTIPGSVSTMDYTFYNCTSLVTAPTIPSSVTHMTDTFKSCTALTGTVTINSSNVTRSSGATYHPFYDTSEAITVEVPDSSTTYTTINTDLPNNVTISTFTP